MHLARFNLAFHALIVTVPKFVHNSVMIRTSKEVVIQIVKLVKSQRTSLLNIMNSVKLKYALAVSKTKN